MLFRSQSFGTITRFQFPQNDWSAVYTHVPFDRPYPIPSDFDPNLALANVWGASIQEAKERAGRLLDETCIEGRSVSGASITTNIDYLRNNLDRLLAF